MRYDNLDILLKYKDIIDLAINLLSIILVFIVSWKGLNTIDKYQSKKKIDLKYQNELLSIEQANKQLHDFNLITNEIHSYFIQFNRNFIDFEHKFDKLNYGEVFNNDEIKYLHTRLEELNHLHRKLQEITSRCFLLDIDIIDIASKYTFFLSDYLYGHSKVLNHIEREKSLPYDIDFKNEYFQTHFVFQGELTAPIFDLFDQIKISIKDSKVIQYNKNEVKK